jgi:enoyl-CoA hydratase/carnithine racemase
VCSPENLESETQKWAQAISMRSPQAVSNTKKIMRDSLEKKFIQTYEDEANTQNSILGNDEFKEGVAAFFEKRKPVFK